MARRRALSSQDNAGLLPFIKLQAATGGGGSSDTPLARTKWIDGNTSVPAGAQNGAPGTPYVSPEAWLLTIPAQPVSLDDAQTVQVGLISPTADDVWTPNPQTWTIHPGRSLVLRNLTSPGITGSTGHVTVPAPESADFTGVVINWTNTETTNPAFNPPSSVVVLDNLNLQSMALTYTDGAGAAPAELVLSGSTGFYQGTVNVSGSTAFKAIAVVGATANLAVTGTNFGLTVSGGSWISAGLSCTSVIATSASIMDTGSNLTTTGAQAYMGCNITANGLLTSGASGISFSNCTFTRGTVISATTAGALVTFDGPSYASFLAAGGTFASGTIVTVQGGYTRGAVAGANVNDPAGNACTVSLTGAGASTGFTVGGNWYTATALAANTTTTISDTGGAVNGDTMRFTRTDTSGNTWTILDATTGTIGQVPAGGNLTASFNGTGWVLQ